MSPLIPVLLALAGTVTTNPYSQKMALSPHVVVYYDTTGVNAVGLQTDVDRNGIPDYVDSIAIHAEGFWADVVGKMGTMPPQYDSTSYPAYPIFVKDILSSASMTEYGYNQASNSAASLVAIENDFRYNGRIDSAISQQPDGKGGYSMVSLPSHPFTLLKGIVYHELMHGVQRNYVTNEQLGKLWSEKVTTWIENRTLGAQGIASHAMEFTSSVTKDFLRGTTASAKYGQSRFLELLAHKAGTAAVLEIYTSRKRWVDSLGLSVVDNPGFETSFFQAILARHGLDWDGFLSAYSEQLARIFLVRSSLFPADEQFFRAGNDPGYDLIASLPKTDTLSPLSFRRSVLPKVQLGAGSIVSVRCPVGSCFATFFNFRQDTLWTTKIDASHPTSVVLPDLNYIEVFLLTGLDSARMEYSRETQGLDRLGRQVARVTWTPGSLRVIGLEGRETARLQAWNLRGNLVLDRIVQASEKSPLPRPMGEGPLVARLGLLP